MNFYWLLLGILTVWRVTHLLSSEDGPWQNVVRLRRAVGDGFWGELMDCFYCLSLWMAAPLAVVIGSGWQEKLLLWPALSAGAILIERVTQRNEAEPAVELQIEENSNVLRTEQESNARSAKP
jgi:hypothetical protein